MLKFLPFIALIAYGLLQWQWSAWRLRRDLEAKARPLDVPELEAVVRRLGRAVDLPHLRAEVYDIPVFNGLAAPDGRVFITGGVVDHFKLGRVTADEVGSIIAHELGHVALGHSKRRMIDWTGQNAMRVALAAVLGRFIPFVGPWIATALASLIAARLSRQDEFEADAFAAALMRKAKVDPTAQPSLLRKLDAMHPPSGGFAWLASHPPAKLRAETIETLHQGWNDQGGAPAPSAQAARKS